MTKRARTTFEVAPVDTSVVVDAHVFKVLCRSSGVSRFVLVVLIKQVNWRYLRAEPVGHLKVRAEEVGS